MLSLSLRDPRLKRLGRRSVFAGARTTRLEFDWLASILSADQEVRSSLVRLRARSRELARDNPHFSAFLKLLKTQVVGSQGIRLQSRITKANGDPWTPFNAGIETAWRAWSDPGMATVDGRLSFREVQGLFLATMAVDGEVLMRHRRGYPNRYGYAVQFLDPDLLDETFDRAAGAGLNQVVMGVELNADLRPVAYHLRTRHPGEMGMTQNRVRVPADEIVHCYLPGRPGQTRGVPWIAPAMLQLKMLSGYAEAELVASRGAAAKAVYYKQNPDAGMDAGTGELVEDIEPGIATLLPPGVDPVQLDAQHPTTAFADFTKSILRSVASALGVSYNSLTSDLESVSFSSIRAGVLQERDHWRDLQRVLIEHLMDPVFRAWLPLAYTTGAVTLPSADVMRWTMPSWKPRGWPWVDPLKDIQAAEAEVRLGVTTRSDICAQRGLDFEETIDGLAMEQDLAADYGVNIDGQGDTNGGSTTDTDGTDAVSDDGPGTGRHVDTWNGHVRISPNGRTVI